VILPETMECYDQLSQMQEATALAFCQLVAKTLRQADTFSVSLSGGSTPRRIYELIAGQDLAWDRIHWFWGDERNVPHDHDDSNTKMVHQALLSRVDVPPQNIHLVPIDVADPNSAAMEYEAILRSHFSSDKFPRWDLSLLGMGDDGHTASLFPGTKAVQERKRWFVENWVSKFDAYRHTLTAPAINSAHQRWFLVSGNAKQDALAKVLSDVRDPNQFPSQLIEPTRWFVTSDAIR